MTERKKRTVHTAEFKAKVGLEAVRGVKTMSEIAQAYSHIVIHNSELIWRPLKNLFTFKHLRMYL